MLDRSRGNKWTIRVLKKKPIALSIIGENVCVALNISAYFSDEYSNEMDLVVS